MKYIIRDKKLLLSGLVLMPVLSYAAPMMYDWGNEARKKRPAGEPYVYKLLKKEPNMNPISMLGK